MSFTMPPDSAQLAHPDAMPSIEQMRPRLYPGEIERTAVDALLR